MDRVARILTFGFKPKQFQAYLRRHPAGVIVGFTVYYVALGSYLRWCRAEARRARQAGYQYRCEDEAHIPSGEGMDLAQYFEAARNGAEQ